MTPKPENTWRFMLVYALVAIVGGGIARAMGWS